MYSLLLILLAHNYWVMPSIWSPALKDTVYCAILAGDNFSHPETDISIKMVRQITIAAPNGDLDTLDPALRFLFIPRDTGVYTIRVELGPKRLPKPRYVLYTLIRVGNKALLKLPKELGEIQGVPKWPAKNQPFKIRFHSPTYVTVLEKNGSEKTLHGETVVIRPQNAGPMLISLEKNKPVISLILEVTP